MSTSARAIVTDFLSRYGLTFSSTLVRKWVGMISDHGATVMPLIDEEIRNTTTFKNRFPGMEARRKAGLNQISVDEYLSLENSYKQIMRGAGLPKGFYDRPNDFSGFIGSDVSPSELEFRVQRGFVAARQAPQEVRDALENLYGIQGSEAALAAYFLDPEVALPVLERQFNTAQISGFGSRSGFDVGREQAEELSSLGVQGDSQIQSGFAQASLARPLTQETIAERDRDLTDRDLVSASFGVSSEAERLLRERLARRRASFSGSAGGAGESAQGSFLGARR